MNPVQLTFTNKFGKIALQITVGTNKDFYYIGKFKGAYSRPH